MRADKHILRWLAILVALVLLAGACGNDSVSVADLAGDGGSSGGDAPEADAPEADAPEADAPEADAPELDLDLPSAAFTATNCADIEEAFNSVGDVAPGSASGPDGDDLKAGLDEFRAQLQALRSEAPEMSADIDAAVAGLDVLSAAYAEFDWDVSNLTDPQDAMALASLLTDEDVMGLFTSMGNIGLWIATNCVS